MKNKQIQLKKKLSSNKAIAILGGQYNVGKDHPNYKLAKSIKTVKSEKVKVVNPITGRKALVTLNRDGTTEERLGAIMLSPDASHDQKLSMISNYLFEQGKENGSFIAELFLSKGKLTKETQAFKTNMRFDFEGLCSVLTTLFDDISDNLIKEIMEPSSSLRNCILHAAERLQEGSMIIKKQRERITEGRLRDKGFGIYVDSTGQSYSIYEKDIEQVIKNDREKIKNDSKPEKV